MKQYWWRRSTLVYGGAVSCGLLFAFGLAQTVAAPVLPASLQVKQIKQVKQVNMTDKMGVDVPVLPTDIPPNNESNNESNNELPPLEDEPATDELSPIDIDDTIDNTTPQTGPVVDNTPVDSTTDGPAPLLTAHEIAKRCVEGADTPCLELNRTADEGIEHRILVIRTGLTDNTGVYIICGRQDDEPENTPTQLVFSETIATGVRIIIDKNVIQVPLAIVTQTPSADAQAGKEKSHVEASAGTATFLEDIPQEATERLVRCGVQTKPQVVPNSVLVTQGKTELKGQKLVYDETDGIARIDGPITFKRQDDKQPLTGTSDRIEVNIDTEKTVLVGNVVLSSTGGRVSKASRVEYDDAKNEARLYGSPEQPAESIKGAEIIRMNTLIYHLDLDEITAEGNITGEFPDSEDDPTQK